MIGIEVRTRRERRPADATEHGRLAESVAGPRLGVVVGDCGVAGVTGEKAPTTAKPERDHVAVAAVMDTAGLWSDPDTVDIVAVNGPPHSTETVT